jgi:hypothetical protein
MSRLATYITGQIVGGLIGAAGTYYVVRPEFNGSSGGDHLIVFFATIFGGFIGAGCGGALGFVGGILMKSSRSRK